MNTPEKLDALLKTQKCLRSEIEQDLIDNYLNSVRGSRKNILENCKRIKICKKLDILNLSSFKHSKKIQEYLDGKIKLNILIEILTKQNEKLLILKNNPNYLNEVSFIIDAYVMNDTYQSDENIISNMNENINRREFLKRELNIFNVEMRNDSELCNQYIHNNSIYTLKQIVDKTVEINWFYNKTDYPNILNNLYEFEFEDMKYSGHYFTPDKYKMSNDAKYKAFVKIMQETKGNINVPNSLSESVKNYETEILNNINIYNLDYSNMDDIENKIFNLFHFKMHTFEDVKKYVKNNVIYEIFDNKLDILRKKLKKSKINDYDTLFQKFLTLKTNLTIDDEHYKNIIHDYVENRKK